MAPGLNGFLQDELSLPGCSDLDSGKKAAQVYSNAAYDYLENGIFNGCFMPCKQTSYFQTIKYYHQTSGPFMTFPADTFSVVIAYNSLEVKTKTEALVYDFVDLLAAAGGNLGLFLGFSCLGCIWCFMDHLGQHL